MSHTLKTIEGAVESNSNNSNRSKSELYVSTFAGKNGTMLQLVPLDDHISLTVDQAKDLIDTIKKGLNI